MTPPAKDGFFNLIFFNLSKKLEAVLVSAVSLLTVGVTIGSGVFSTAGATSLVTSAAGVGSGIEVGCSSIGGSVVSGWATVSFSLFVWISSNHFSYIGSASSIFGVPDEEIFCFPSI